MRFHGSSKREADYHGRQFMEKCDEELRRVPFSRGGGQHAIAEGFGKTCLNGKENGVCSLGSCLIRRWGTRNFPS